MLVVVGYTDTPTWICPGDWDQILHLSKATLHQRHSNEVVFYCKLSSRGVCACMCVYIGVSFCLRPVRSEKVTKKKNQGKKRLKERCVGLSSLSVSKRGIHKKCACSVSVHKSLESIWYWVTVSNAWMCEEKYHLHSGFSEKMTQISHRKCFDKVQFFNLQLHTLSFI